MRESRPLADQGDAKNQTFRQLVVHTTEYSQDEHALIVPHLLTLLDRVGKRLIERGRHKEDAQRRQDAESALHDVRQVHLHRALEQSGKRDCDLHTSLFVRRQQITRGIIT